MSARTEPTSSDVKDSTVSYVIHTNKTHTENITRRSCWWSNFICTLWHCSSRQNATEHYQNLPFFKRPLLTYQNVKQIAQYFSKSTISVAAMAQGDRSCQLQSLHLLCNFEFVGILISNWSSNHQVLTVRTTEACLLLNLGKFINYEKQKKNQIGRVQLHYMKELYLELVFSPRALLLPKILESIFSLH